VVVVVAVETRHLPEPAALVILLAVVAVAEAILAL
jgi:hypothetical protein